MAELFQQPEAEALLLDCFLTSSNRLHGTAYSGDCQRDLANREAWDYRWAPDRRSTRTLEVQLTRADLDDRRERVHFKRLQEVHRFLQSRLSAAFPTGVVMTIRAEDTPANREFREAVAEAVWRRAQELLSRPLHLMQTRRGNVFWKHGKQASTVEFEVHGGQPACKSMVLTEDVVRLDPTDARLATVLRRKGDRSPSTEVVLLVWFDVYGLDADDLDELQRFAAESHVPFREIWVIATGSDHTCERVFP